MSSALSISQTNNTEDKKEVSVETWPSWFIRDLERKSRVTRHDASDLFQALTAMKKTYEERGIQIDSSLISKIDELISQLRKPWHHYQNIRLDIKALLVTLPPVLFRIKHPESKFIVMENETETLVQNLFKEHNITGYMTARSSSGCDVYSFGKNGDKIKALVQQIPGAVFVGDVIIAENNDAYSVPAKEGTIVI